MIPGDYFVVGLRDRDAGDWPDQKFLERIAPSAEAIHVEPGKNASTVLKLRAVR
jgi:hypothetical protein